MTSGSALCRELEACLELLAAVDSDLEGRVPPGASVDQFLKGLAQLERVVTAHPDVEFPAAALEPDCDWDALTATTLRESLEGLEVSENRRLHARDLADLVEAAVA